MGVKYMRLGDTQKEMLKILRKKEYWFKGCGWLWDTHSNTARILDGLVKKELVTNANGVYKVTSLGKSIEV